MQTPGNARRALSQVVPRSRGGPGLSGGRTGGRYCRTGGGRGSRGAPRTAATPAGPPLQTPSPPCPASPAPIPGLLHHATNIFGDSPMRKGHLCRCLAASPAEPCAHSRPPGWGAQSSRTYASTGDLASLAPISAHRTRLQCHDAAGIAHVSEGRGRACMKGHSLYISCSRPSLPASDSFCSTHHTPHRQTVEPETVRNTCVLCCMRAHGHGVQVLRIYGKKSCQGSHAAAWQIAIGVAQRCSRPRGAGEGAAP